MVSQATLRTLFAQLVINTQSAMALRASFALSCGFMFLNNLLFFVNWLILFTKVETIGGWDLSDCALMYGVVATSFGCGVIVFGGVLDLARTIEEGALDPILVQPRHALLAALTTRSATSGWGDLASGLLLISLSGLAAWDRIPLIAVAILFSTTIFISTGVIIQSIAFWVRSCRSLLWQGFEFLICFSTYPGPIFTGWLRIFLFTVIPAGFISTLPVEAIRNRSFGTLLGVGLAAVVYSGLALTVFHYGLKRYSSGSRLTVRS